MPSTPLSFSRLLGAVAASVVVVGMLGAAQSPADVRMVAQKPRD